MTFVYRRWSFLHFLHMTFVYIICHISAYFLLSPCPSWHVSFEWNMSGTVLSTMECQALRVTWNSGYFPVQKFCQKVTEVIPVRDQNLWDIIGDKWDLICLCFCLRNSGAQPKNHIAGQTVEFGLLFHLNPGSMYIVYLLVSGFNLWYM